MRTPAHSLPSCNRPQTDLPLACPTTPSGGHQTPWLFLYSLFCVENLLHTRNGTARAKCLRWLPWWLACSGCRSGVVHRTIHSRTPVPLHPPEHMGHFYPQPRAAAVSSTNKAPPPFLDRGFHGVGLGSVTAQVRVEEMGCGASLTALTLTTPPPPRRVSPVSVRHLRRLNPRGFGENSWRPCTRASARRHDVARGLTPAAGLVGVAVGSGGAGRGRPGGERVAGAACRDPGGNDPADPDQARGLPDRGQHAV